LLDIQLQSDKESATVIVRGKVDIHSSPQLRQTLKPLLTADRKRIYVDLRDVSFMDSSGIATLVEGLQWSREHGGHFILSGLSRNVQDVFELAKLDTVFEIARDDQPSPTSTNHSG
jgi:anti-sigma B factor antagonist